MACACLRNVCMFAQGPLLSFAMLLAVHSSERTCLNIAIDYFNTDQVHNIPAGPRMFLKDKKSDYFLQANSVWKGKKKQYSHSYIYTKKKQ